MGQLAPSAVQRHVRSLSVSSRTEKITRKKPNLALVFRTRITRGKQEEKLTAGDIDVWKKKIASLAEEFGGVAMIDKTQSAKLEDERAVKVVPFYIPHEQQAAFFEAAHNHSFNLRTSVIGFKVLGKVPDSQTYSDEVRPAPQPLVAKNG